MSEKTAVQAAEGWTRDKQLHKNTDWAERIRLDAARHDALADEVRKIHNLVIDLCMVSDSYHDRIETIEKKPIGLTSFEACREMIADSIEELRTRADDHQRRLEQIEKAV